MRKRAIILKGARCAEPSCRKWVDLDDEESIKKFDFHHLDPSEKEYPLSRLPSSSWPVLERELKKCILLCKECHMGKYHGKLPFSSADDRMALAYRDHAERMGGNDEGNAGDREDAVPEGRPQAGCEGRGGTGLAPDEEQAHQGKAAGSQVDAAGCAAGSGLAEEGEAVAGEEGQAARCGQGAGEAQEAPRGKKVEEEVPF